MKKTILFSILFFILLISFVSAGSGCIVNENCTYYAYSDEAGLSAVNISILDSDGNFLVQDGVMTSITSETFKYVYNHNQSGQVVAIAKYYNGTALLSSNSQTKEVREQEVTENNMVIFGILFLILGISALLFFASTQTTSNNMTSIRRLPEKVLLFVTGLLMLPVSWYFAIVHVNATPSLSHLYAPLNTFFSIFILVLFALLFFYFYNMLKILAFDSIIKDEEYDGKE